MTTLYYTVQPLQQPIYIQPIQMQPIHIQQPIPAPKYEISQPIPQPVPQSPKNWNTGLCDCLISPCICLQGLLCPCCLYGKNNKEVSNDTFCGSMLCYLLCFPCCQQTKTRYLIRQKYNLLAQPCDDCCVSWFCTPCALCQERREIEFQLSKPQNQSMS